ncbi:MAG: response regulator [Candidatus Nitrohelix vancouverensis]|uniref:histidine kinase n=1 Tax=Candidatus Nitrohelix vancouverensis TaxID=2705534 RepID=A0A7T0C422_9BACT|nr:MAG: response regulator [Candidatus Nitrohelix vancouverensis]
MTATATHKILLVEDNPHERRRIRRLLNDDSEQSYDISEADNGEKGLSLCREVDPDCMVLDFFLPDTDGLELLYEMKKGAYRGAVVMLTGEGNEKIAVEALKAGAHDYMVKDKLTSGALKHSIRSAIQLRQLQIDKVKVEDDLRESNHSLEERVRERTLELEQINVELRQHIIQRKKIEIELLQSKEQAELANRAKSEFLSRMSHELRTPLNSILGFSDVMLMNAKEPPSEKQENYLKYITQAGRHLLSLINEVLDLAKIEAGKISISVEPFSLVTAVNDVITSISALSDQKKIKLVNEIKEPLDLIVHMDPMRFKQILLNLVSNAIKYNRMNGTVTLSLDMESDLLRLNVRDEGAGIPEENFDKIFKPFDRLGAEKSVIEGTGIGLSIAQKLAILMDGKIEIASVQGEGSCFSFAFPRERLLGIHAGR